MNADFQRIENPYITGNPVRGSQPFFGRESDFADLEQRLRTEKEGIVLLFVGGRRSGKTSIMFQILDGRLGEDFLPIFVDMQQLAGIHGNNDFLGRIGRIIVEAVDDDRLALDLYDFSTGNPILVLDSLLADVAKIAPDRRLLFLVDEAEILRDKVDKEEISGAVLTYLASILESRGVSFCFTGSAGLAEADVQEWRRLLGKGDFKEISFLSPADTMRLVQEPLGDSVQFDEGVKESIYELTFGHPFYTQLICTNAVDLLNGEQRNQLTAEDLSDVVHTIVNNPPPQLIYDWDQFEPQEQLALSLLSEVTEQAHTPVSVDKMVEAIADNSYPIDLAAESIHILLDGLDEKRVLERTEDHEYFFLIDLVRMWVRRNRSIWRLVEEGEDTRSGSRGRWLVAAVVALVFVGAGAVWMQRDDDQVARLAAAAQAAVPTTGDLEFLHYPPGSIVSVRGPLDKPLHDTVRVNTPNVVKDRMAGRYEVTVEHDLYAGIVDTLTVAAGVDSTVGYNLMRLHGELVVEASPADATIRVRSEEMGFDSSGSAPFALDVETGAYTVDVSRQGYLSQRITAQVNAHTPVLPILALQANVGHLLVESTPPGASIFIDGRSTQATTPVVIDSLAVGERRVELRLVDHDTRQRIIAINLDDTSRLHLDLTQTAAIVLLVSNPTGAQVFIDDSDAPVGTTPYESALPPGEHRLRLVYAGYDEHETRFAIEPGETLRVAPIGLTQQFGWVKVISPKSGHLSIDDGAREVDGFFGTIQLPVGKHRLEIRGRGAKEAVVVNGDTLKLDWR
ncbi:MAG: PEGA domain-containing protein [Gemmatimonadetes bacterium]|nr:PEGA domain-containing protein [Gemmatimonadota bacterium]